MAEGENGQVSMFLCPVGTTPMPACHAPNLDRESRALEPELKLGLLGLTGPFSAGVNLGTSFS